MKKNRKLLFLVLIIFVSIGFAYLTATLGINGTAGVKGATWDIHFASVNVTTGSVTASEPTINNEGDTVTYLAQLNEPGDFYEFTVNAVNAGTMDGMIDTFTNTVLTEEQAKYLNYSVTYADGVKVKQGEYLRVGDSVTYKVRVEFQDDPEVLPSEDTDVQPFTFNVTYRKSDKKQYFEIVSQSTPNQLSVGDEVAVGTEHFNVVSSNSITTVLLAKYNLNVGYNYSLDEGNHDIYEEIDIKSDSYGLQNPLALYDENLAKTSNSIVLFSDTSYYWLDNPTGSITQRNVLSTYGNESPYYIYDESYDGKPNYYVNCLNGEYMCFLNVHDGDNYSIAYYVKQYGGILNRLGASSNISLRLLSYEEAVSLGCDEENGDCSGATESTEFITNTQFYLGSLESKRKIYEVVVDQLFDVTTPTIASGVRPVVEIPTSEILG